MTHTRYDMFHGANCDSHFIIADESSFLRIF